MTAEYFQLKKYEKSIDACKQAIKANQRDKQSWLTLGANYFHLNDDGPAYFCFHRASILTSKKAKSFLDKAKNLKDKMFDAAVIDVASEILGKKKPVKTVEKLAELEIKERRFYRPEIPNPKNPDYMKRLSSFLFELGEDLIPITGGVISFLDLFAHIREQYPLFSGKPEDIIEALKKLEKKGLIVGIKYIENSKIKIVEFVPSDLTKDINKILTIASETEYLTFEEILTKTKWEEYRAERAIEFLEEKEIAIETKSFREGRKWFFPGINS